jgi:hypothetical protein
VGNFQKVDIDLEMEWNLSLLLFRLQLVGLILSGADSLGEQLLML